MGHADVEEKCALFSAESALEEHDCYTADLDHEVEGVPWNCAVQQA